MKKVLIITYNPIHNKQGGTEVYSEKLINIFHKLKWDVTEFSLDVKNERDQVKNSDHILIYPSVRLSEKLNLSNLSRLKKAKRELDALKKSNSYDLIINNLGNGFKWEYIPNNEILVQHFDINYYNGISMYKNKFFAWIMNKISLWITGFKDYMLTHDNVVFFTKENYEFACKYYNKHFNKCSFIHLSRFDEKTLKAMRKYNPMKKVVYLGRINNFQKNFKFLVKMSKHLRYEIDVYGDGPAKKLIKKSKNIKYCGLLDFKNTLRVLSKYLCSICVSRFEGEPFSLIESCCAQTPIAVRNTFLCAKALVSNNNGLLLDKKLSPKKCANAINSYLDKLNWKDQAKRCKDLALQKFPNEVFEEKWIDYINQF